MAEYKNISDNEQQQLTQIQKLLLHNVPRFGAQIKSKGGVSEDEWNWLKSEESDTDYPAEVLIRADEYLLYPKDSAAFEHGLFTLVLTLALMAFVPGGVRCFDLHFDARSENFLGADNGSSET